MEITGCVSRFLLASFLLVVAAVAALPEAWAEESRRRSPQRIAVPTLEDGRDPAVFERNLRSVAEKTIALGGEVGLSAGILEHVAELKRELATTGATELAAQAEQMGPHVARVERAMARIVVAPAPGEVPAVAFDDPDPDGPWHKELDALAQAAYPTAYGIDVDTEASGQGTSSPKVCSVHKELGCEVDEDCPEDETCIDRPAAPSATQQVIIVRGCTTRPLEAGLKALGESATDVEAAQMVMNRICNQVIAGFNGSIACIFTDLAALVQRRLLDSEVTCKQLWAEAESRSSYSRLAVLKEKEEELKAKSLQIESGMLLKFGSAETQVNGFQSDTSTKFAAVNTNIDGTRSLLGTNIDNTRTALETKTDGARDLLNTNIDGSRAAVQTNVDTTRTAILDSLGAAGTLLNNNIEFTRNLLHTNIDDSRAAVNANVDNTRVLLNTNIDTTRTTLLALLTTQNESFLRAELERILLHRERLAIYYLPEAQGGKLAQLRQIVETTITRVEASNETVNQARTYLGYAVTDINAGRFKRAFGYLSSAYFEAIRGVGEQQAFWKTSP